MRSIYLVLDMQNDLVHEEGPNGKSPLGEQVRARGILERTAAAIARARKAGMKVGFVRVGFSEGYPECPEGSQVFSGAPKAGLFRLGTPGTEIHPALGVEPGDIQVVKHRVSPFYATGLEAALRAQKIERIFCSGVSTQAVVQATVRDGHDRDYQMVVLEDCCAAHSAQEHANSMQSLGRFCTVAGSADFG
ncbi:cysteine hydrolase [Achromobacter veterisilvae]|uniref:Cysteine hydrolase n=1 Tax=Achromobacter veterisilvae TaxID=2069367 RepID=A0A446CQJ2_9BURK|nr:cysteine hydrolase [Achromobacter veterisilvae]SSW70108.1 Isochorismatase family protein YecD [Achromobacter veterisilvae]